MLYVKWTCLKTEEIKLVSVYWYCLHYLHNVSPYSGTENEHDIHMELTDNWEIMLKDISHRVFSFFFFFCGVFDGGCCLLGQFWFFFSLFFFFFFWISLKLRPCGNFENKRIKGSRLVYWVRFKTNRVN